MTNLTNDEIEAWLKIQEESAAGLRKRWQNVVADDGRRFMDEQIAYERERAAKIVRQLLEERQWREIESAPKDGTPVIIAVTGRETIVGEARWWEVGDDSDWFWVGHGPGDYYGAPLSEVNFGSPTHWMPLPLPPSPETGEE